MVEYSPKKGLVWLETPKEEQFLAHTHHLHMLNDRNEIPGYPKGKPEGEVSGKTIARQAKADELTAGKGPEIFTRKYEQPRLSVCWKRGSEA